MEAPQMQPYSEQELISQIKAGEKQLFYSLIQPYERGLYLAAFSIVQNEADAEDVAQEAVLKALSHLDQFRGEAKFSTWLIQICINEAKMRLRRDHKDRYESIDSGQETEEGDYVPMDVADWREIPSDALAHKELKEALARALASLQPKYREVFVLRDVQGMSIAEAAEVLGITQATVKMRLMRARLQMRDSLAPGYDGSWTRGEKHYRPVRSATFY
ncbi:MAG TPA: sigma-70 family RNA polymerase sigma factor [Terriglobales bacterium]|nr:sigma-70 family RNA polymerase sigma factor [Terriglobales bacterium]